MFLNVLLFNFFLQVSLLWHQLLIHCQDSSAVFLMPFIFVPDMFGMWGAGKEAGAAASLLPKQFHRSVWTQTLLQTLILLGQQRLFLSSCHEVNNISNSPSIHISIASHNSKPYEAGKLRDLCFFPAFTCMVWSFAQTNSFVFKHSFDCSHPVFFTFIILLLWLLQMTIISHPNSDSFDCCWGGFLEIESQLLCQGWEISGNVLGFHWQAWVLAFVILGFLSHGSHARAECLTWWLVGCLQPWGK